MFVSEVDYVRLDSHFHSFHQETPEREPERKSEPKLIDIVVASTFSSRTPLSSQHRTVPNDAREIITHFIHILHYLSSRILPDTVTF